MFRATAVRPEHGMVYLQAQQCDVVWYGRFGYTSLLDCFARQAFVLDI
jgi:hypothetical protein